MIPYCTIRENPGAWTYTGSTECRSESAKHAQQDRDCKARNVDLKQCASHVRTRFVTLHSSRTDDGKEVGIVCTEGAGPEDVGTAALNER